MGTIQLLQCSVKSSVTSKKTFCIEFITPSRTFYAAAKTQGEMTEWMNALKEAITKNLGNFFEQSSRKNSTTSVPSIPTLSEGGSKDSLDLEQSDGSSSSSSHQILPEIAKMLTKPENSVCAECKAPGKQLNLSYLC